jgi:hypothetical protein
MHPLKNNTPSKLTLVRIPLITPIHSDHSEWMTAINRHAWWRSIQNGWSQSSV